MNPSNNSALQRFSHLDIPIKYQHLTGIKILVPVVGSLIPLLTLIIDTMHSHVYHSNNCIFHRFL
jgi:hypothetical protein